ncbi:conserved hypothetical protein [Talaromyces stipitatus ATCC 10500]|uniref:LRR-containing protein second PH domain-containing protein n=1 Tax=Talaromyces stipitatus (strain ATCC 10500 / CBS 375.48 / QM 6759 / NRRL 1006) TaxID=441959 RepID=B8MS40_TALSN|nr:uncharacterized protein TSTA_004860 [Talaromyces stipitatus ATCC 10500]EED12445.1 conserved hypothetical protein [Talaromyces stipitatus ATCC 10500]
MAETNVGKRERRKSFTFFHHSHQHSSSPTTTTVPSVSLSHDRSASDGLSTVKRPRRNSGFFGSRDPSPRGTTPNVLRRPQTSESEVMALDTNKQKRKSQQPSRRASMFGSFRSLQSMEDELAGQRSRSDSIDDNDVINSPLTQTKKSLGHVVLHHGEVQTAGTMWRKRNHYLVLTDTHLIRFKSQHKAADLFPTINVSSGRATPVNHRQSIVSVASAQDHTFATYSGDVAAIALNSIVSVSGVEDGRQTNIELSYLDDRTNKAAFMAIQLTDPEEQHLWLVGIRSASQSARAAEPFTFETKTIDYVVRILEQDRDYDPENFNLFRVIQRAPTKQNMRSSTDDLGKWSATMCYLAIGLHRIHLIPLYRGSSRSSLVSLSEMDLGASLGLMALTSLMVHSGDDRFQLAFRVPLQSATVVNLASVHSLDIALWIRQRTEFLRPLWLHQPYEIIGPAEVADEDLIPSPELVEDFGCFDRTLVAYSASYNVDTSNIRYTVDLECEDAPCFRLLPPASKRRSQYNALELLALMRALRYNESFISISFSGVNLDVLQNCRDRFEADWTAFLTRAGAQVSIAGQDRLSLLSQEIRALALKSKRLRRLDFSFCLSRTPISDRGARDPGCGIPEAIFPLCRRQLTNVDWIVLNGIKLGDSDLDYIVDAASQRTSHLRALEVGECGLSVHDLDLILSTLTAQETTLEAVNISGIQGRLSPELFQQQIGYFGQIRKINLTRVARTSGPEPLIAPETLLNWRLEELSLSQTAVNKETVDSIAAYLASDRSSSLRVLRLDQCGLTGGDVATFLRCMTRPADKARDMHLHVSENHLDTNYSLLFDAIADNNTPTHLSMRMIDFKKEDHFRELIEAMKKNNTLKYLDISKASLPYDAGPETCEALQLMFEQNETLEELDISGEYAHLDVARFGIGLNQALTGLKKNKSLKVLRIEHQKLGLQGANTLASVLEENTTLREIYCENNDMNLQSFTVLVNGLQHNDSVTFLPVMNTDRHQSLERVRREFVNVKRDTSHQSGPSSIRRSLHAAIAIGQPSGGHKLAKSNLAARSKDAAQMLESSASEPVDQEVEATLQSLNRKWDIEVDRLRQYLYRNYCTLNGIPYDADGYQDLDAVEENDSAEASRPATSASLGVMISELEKLDINLSMDEMTMQNIFQSNSGNSGNSTDSERDALVMMENSSGSSSPVVTMSSVQSTPTIDSIKLMDSLRPLSPASSASENKPTTQLKEYAASSSSSPQLSLPVPAIFKVPPPPSIKNGSSAASIRSNCSSNMSTSTAPRAPSFRSTGGTSSLSASSLRKLLSTRPSSAMNGMRQISGGYSSNNSSMTGSATGLAASDEPPRIIWSPPKVDL